MAIKVIRYIFAGIGVTAVGLIAFWLIAGYFAGHWVEK